MKTDIHYELCQKAADLMARFTDGHVLVAALSDHMDRIVSEVYRNTAAHNIEGLALIAVGGYGRQQLSPFSDVDLVLLAAEETSAITDAAKHVLYGLWDRGVKISHSFRTISNCTSDAMREIQIRTSLFEHRFIAGDRNVYDQFCREVYPRILFKDKRKFLGELLRETDRRHRTFGESLYLLEPNVKEGQGALRDAHTASWLSRSNLAADLFSEYGRICPGRSFQEFFAAVAFLLRIRTALHCISSRRNDVLSFEVQSAVAAQLGLHDTKSYLAPELLLRVYYRKAQVISDTLHQVMRRCGNRYFPVTCSFQKKRVTEHFTLVRNEIILNNNQQPLVLELLLEAFSAFAATGRGFSAQLEHFIRLQTLRIKTPAVFSHAALQAFWAIMKSDRVFETLSIMHRFRFLEKIIPEFGRLRNLVIFEMYHRYTVDEHTLIAIRNAEMLRHRYEPRRDYLRRFFSSIRPEIFYFAVLVHDIGKGNSRRHEGIGYRLLKPILERFSISAEDGARIAFLVRNHIVFSKLALRRDPESLETIHQLAETVGNEANLDALYLMTYADMSAVSPDFWTDWKDSLFQVVYKKTSDMLRAIEADRPRISDVDLLRFVESMPERYQLSHTLSSIQADYERVQRAQQEQIVISFDEHPNGVEEITIVSYKMQRIFKDIVGVLSSRGLNIARARIYRSQDGVAIRKIAISNWAALWWEGMTRQIEHDLRASIFGHSRITPIREAASQLFSARRYESFIEIDNEVSNTFTILELHFPDRLGLLYDIMTMLYALEVDIDAAVINTDEDMAEDIFYVHRHGNKLTAEHLWNLLGSVWDVAVGKLSSGQTT